MPTPFGVPANNVVAFVGSGGYTAGSGTLALAPGQGAQFPALASGWFYRITVVQQIHAYDPLMTPANYTVFKATSLTADTFSGVTVVEGTTDQNYVGGDVVDVRTTAGTLNDIQVAVNLLEFLTNVTAVSANTVLTSAAFGTTILCSGTSANYTVKLPNPSGNAGKIISFRMAPTLTRLVQINPFASELIDGASARVMWANEVATLFCDGATWTKIAGKSIPMYCSMALSANQAIPTSVETLITLNVAALDTTGLMADTTNHRILILRPGVYTFYCGVLWVAMPAASPNTYVTLQKNSADYSYLRAPTIASGQNTTLYASFVYAGSVAGDNYELTTLHTSGSNSSIYGGNSGSSLTAVETPLW